MLLAKGLLRSPEACWGNYELSPVPREKGVWEVKDLRAQAGLICCNRKGPLDLLYPPQLQALHPIRMSGETAFLSIGQSAQGQRSGLSYLYLTLLRVKERHGMAFLFDVPSAQLHCLCA